MVNLKKTKPAIAMIELIFSLVIIGIVLLSAPMLIQQSVKSGQVALQQEAIAAAASHASIILAMHWDESNANLPVGTSPILNTNRVPFDFNLTDLPDGIIGVSGRNMEDDNQTIAPTVIGLDDNETNTTAYDDVDDYHNKSFGLVVFRTENTSSDVGDYVDIDLNMSTQVNYAEDIPQGTIFNTSNIQINATGLSSPINNTSIGAMSNIKFIRVHLTSDSGIDELNKSIVMQAFSCNIGTTIPGGTETW